MISCSYNGGDICFMITRNSKYDCKIKKYTLRKSLKISYSASSGTTQGELDFPWEYDFCHLVVQKPGDRRLSPHNGRQTQAEHTARSARGRAASSEHQVPGENPTQQARLIPLRCQFRPKSQFSLSLNHTIGNILKFCSDKTFSFFVSLFKILCILYNGGHI